MSAPNHAKDDMTGILFAGFSYVFWGVMPLYWRLLAAVPPFELSRLAGGGSLFVTRPTLVNYVATREELLGRAGDVYGWIADGSLDVRIGSMYALEDARQAQEDLESRRTTGKLLLSVRPA